MWLCCVVLCCVVPFLDLQSSFVRRLLLYFGRALAVVNVHV